MSRPSADPRDELLDVVDEHDHETPEHEWWCAVYSVCCGPPVDPPVDEVAWYAFLPEAELDRRLTEWSWTPDSLEAYHRLRLAA